MVDADRLRQFEDNIRRLRGEKPRAPIVPKQPKGKPMTNQVVAYSPNELVAAQSTVRGWCAENIRRQIAERKDAEANLEVAKRAKFRTGPFKAVINRCGRRIEYYKKLGAAIKQGYMIVPNFDMELFAVRTDQRRPRQETSRWNHERFPQIGGTLPEGAGRYVNPSPVIFERSYQEPNAKKEMVTVTDYNPEEFREEIEFPVSIVKPHIIAETRRAMGYRLFDQIGIARGSRQQSGARRDPIVLGRIWDRTRNDQCVTFFIAWWLDKEMI